MTTLAFESDLRELTPEEISSVSGGSDSSTAGYVVALVAEGVFIAAATAVAGPVGTVVAGAIVITLNTVEDAE